MSNVITALTALATLVVTSGAYDFRDAYFNQHLANELLDFYNSPDKLLHARNRRDEEAVKAGKCQMFGPPACCGQDLHKRLMDGDDKKQCFEEVMGKDTPSGPPPDPFRCDKSEKHKENMMCVMQCVAQKRNVLDANGQLKEDEARENVKETLGELEWLKPKLDEIIAKCLKEANKKSEELKSNPSGCSPAPLKMNHCMFREIQMACPDDQIKDKKACDRMREDLQKFGDVPPPPPQ